MEMFFLYREALLRVKNPHAFVELTHGSYDYILPEDTYRKKLYDLLLAAKRKKTEFSKKIDYIWNNWDELFPIEENPQWVKVIEKLN
jgi:hypothetical protein